ncbi:hypothetical protein Q1695_001628 [Nippostrongylus brasiliensis]|nr:hypothetical protein Q1695_001628 [Nippostrongylus brasiliensis]
MTNKRRFGGQNYVKIRKQCIKSGHLFVDTLFPPTNASLFLEQGRSSDIVWKRPPELHDDPHLFVEGASPNDVTQGILGNCWFVSACSALTHNQHLLNRVIPDAESQEWSPKRHYAGIFRFRFWRFGRWVEVVIDDLLPTREGKLLFARSKTPNEFWSALLEKAFAKLYGCYENLVGGHLSDALQDVSGGVAETINIARFLRSDAADTPQLLFNNLKEAFDNDALIVAAIAVVLFAAKTKDEIEQTLDCGLVKGHAYAVTAVRYVELDARSGGFRSAFGFHDRIQMIRLQNPWGEKEWNGPWSDDSKEWEQVTDSQKHSLGITVDEDGEFWMPWTSFIEFFTDISVCQMFNTKIFSLSKRYCEEIFYGEWTSNGVKSGAPDDFAGGCLNFSATFCNNPQFLLNVSRRGEIMLALTQKEPNEGMKRRDPYVTIGIHVMKVENNRIHRVHQAMNPAGTSDYASARSIFLHMRDVPVGRYIAMPTTFAPREQSTFMLRIYSDHNIDPQVLLKHAPSMGFFGCRRATSVTRITVVDLYLERAEDVNAYCVVKMGKSVSRTTSVKGSDHLLWDEQFVFHRNSSSEEFTIELWNDRHLAGDRLLSRVHFSGPVDNDTRELQLKLSDSHGNSVGHLKVVVAAFDDPLYL